MLSEDAVIMFEAAAYASQCHRYQHRKGPGKEAYIVHPMAVAELLLNRGGVRDRDVLIAAMLHDTVEDTDATLVEIEARFGSAVAGIVAEVTDDKTLDKVSRKRGQIEHVQTASKGARLVKLADKLDNLRSMSRSTPSGWSRSVVQGYFGWAKMVVNAGLRGVCEPLEHDIDQLWHSKLVDGDGEYEALPVHNDADLDAFVEKYYKEIEGRP